MSEKDYSEIYAYKVSPKNVPAATNAMNGNTGEGSSRVISVTELPGERYFLVVVKVNPGSPQQQKRWYDVFSVHSDSYLSIDNMGPKNESIP